ncbi:hypothetical protein QYF36_023989 [Acer negundo]|nr:hypothetical protein QYF36_023989 [Acer negundo]
MLLLNGLIYQRSIEVGDSHHLALFGYLHIISHAEADVALFSCVCVSKFRNLFASYHMLSQMLLCWLTFN